MTLLVLNNRALDTALVAVTVHLFMMKDDKNEI